MRESTSTRLARLLGCAILLAAGAARADGDIARVRKLFDSGTTHYNLTEYREALSDFTEAYRIRHDPAFLFNIGQAHRQLGETEKAVQFYRNYLRAAPEARNHREVEALIAEGEKALEDKRAARTPTAIEPPQPATIAETRADKLRDLRDPFNDPWPVKAVSASPSPPASSPPPESPPPESPPPESSPPESSPSPRAAPTPAAPAVDLPAASVTLASGLKEPPEFSSERPRRTWLWVTLGVAGAVVVGTAVGLGVGLSGRAQDPSTTFGTYTAVFQ